MEARLRYACFTLFLPKPENPGETRRVANPSNEHLLVFAHLLQTIEITQEQVLLVLAVYK